MKNLLILIAFIYGTALYFGQEKNLEWDTKLIYRAASESNNVYDGFILHYINSKDYAYSAVFLSELKNYRNDVYRSSYTQNTIVIENQDSVFSISKSDLFENDYTMDFSSEFIKMNLFDSASDTLQFRKKGALVNKGEYTCQNYEISIDYSGMSFCIDEENKVDNISTVFPKKIRGSLKGLVVSFSNGSYKFELQSIENIKGSITYNEQEARDLQRELIQAKENKAMEAMPAPSEPQTEISDVAEEAPMAVGEVAPANNQIENSKYRREPYFCRSYYYELSPDIDDKLAILIRGFVQKVCSETVYFENEDLEIDEDAYYPFVMKRVDAFEKEVKAQKVISEKELDNEIQNLKNYIEIQKGIEDQTIEDFDFK